MGASKASGAFGWSGSFLPAQRPSRPVRSDIHFAYMQGICVMRVAKGKGNMYAKCKFILTRENE